MQRRIVSLWFPRLSSDRALRRHPVCGPFALTRQTHNSDILHGLNPEASAIGLHPGMSLADARALCPDLHSRPADLAGDQAFLDSLQRWALRYCPWVGPEEPDGLVMDITGAAHLQHSESGLVADLRRRLNRSGIEVAIGLADNRGAAWALAHYGGNGGGTAAPGATAAILAALPVAGLRLEAEMVTALQRLGLRHIGDLAQAARAPLARRFGRGLLIRLDQAFGDQPEAITPAVEPVHYAVRLTLPEPIGLAVDVVAALARLLDPLCAKLKAQNMGARVLRLSLRRVDGASLSVTLRLAGAMRAPDRILPLFTRQVEALDAGFGIDQLRLEALLVEPLAARQIGAEAASQDQLDALLTRIGSRIGLENILRFVPRDSHLPERAFALLPACDSTAQPWSPQPWTPRARRPLRLFRPEPILAEGNQPPQRFRWRGMSLTLGRSSGPERIAPEWWRPVEGIGPQGLRDYWRVETQQGRRLWMFHTPQNPGWFVQGEFL